MNRIYKVIFSREKGMLVVASELAKTAVKSGTKLVAATVVGAALSVGGVAYAQTAQIESGAEGSNFVVRDAGLVVSNKNAEISNGNLLVQNGSIAAKDIHNVGNTTSLNDDGSISVGKTTPDDPSTAKTTLGNDGSVSAAGGNFTVGADGKVTTRNGFVGDVTGNL